MWVNWESQCGYNKQNVPYSSWDEICDDGDDYDDDYDVYDDSDDSDYSDDSDDDDDDDPCGPIGKVRVGITSKMSQKAKDLFWRCPPPGYKLQQWWWWWWVLWAGPSI